MNSSYLYINDLRFHYLHWNLEHGYQPIVLLHGLASNARIWELVAPYLVEQGFSVYALDQRGHGLTDKPDGDYGIGTFSRDLLAFLDACQVERPILVGHSWGGLVVLDYGAQYVVGPRAPAGVFLVDGGLIQLDDVPGATWDEVRVRFTPPRLAGMALDEFLLRLDQWTSRLDDPEAATPIILANFEIAEDEIISPRLTFERHMQIVRSMWEFKTYERFERIRCPLAAVMALPPAPRSIEEEEFIKIKQRGVSRALELQPGLYVEWMKDTVHDIPLHRPAKLADLISDFAHTRVQGT